MGIFGSLLKLAKRGSPVRNVVEDIGEAVLPPPVVNAINMADRLGVDDAIARVVAKKKPRPKK